MRSRPGIDEQALHFHTIRRKRSSVEAAGFILQGCSNLEDATSRHNPKDHYATNSEAAGFILQGSSIQPTPAG
jgi:hypothetical protein